MCNGQGACVCAPKCAGKKCGDDGCGGNCGLCSVDQTCNPSGQCVCTPNCTNKTCGPNGCGGSCGICGAGTSCSAGSCVPNGCDPVANLGCTPGNDCLILSNETTTCAVGGAGHEGSSCSASVTCD